MSAAADEQSAEDGAEEAAQNSASTSDDISNKKHLCSHCGIVVICTKTQHEEGHEKSEGFSCAVCGVFGSNRHGRNSHEKKVHCFQRAEADEGVRGAVKISKIQLRKLVNVGFKLAEVQATAVASAAHRTEDDATEEELLAIMKKAPQKEGLVCSTCGVQSHDRSSAQCHASDHHSTGRFVCSLCGIRKAEAGKRNDHEGAVHDFYRHPNDERREETIRIAPEQWARYSQTGTKVAEIQANAVESYANIPPGRLESLAVPEHYAKIACRICGYKLCGKYFIEKHEADHSINGFECSACGLRKTSFENRNQHERDVHEFFREKADKKQKGPIQIPQAELAHLKNVGRNVQEVQGRAIPSGSNAEPNGEQREANRRHTIANPLQSVQSPRAVRKRPAVGLIQLDDKQPRTAKKPNIGLPAVPRFPPPLAASHPSAPLLQPLPVVEQPATFAVAPSACADDTWGVERSAVRLMTALTAKPRVVYDDHRELSTEFNVLPVRWWASARESAFLLLRSATLDWTGNVPLPPATFHFTLADQFGDVLCFAKPTGAAAADHLRQLVASELSFARLMAIIRELDFPSVLIVAGDADRAAVRHMSCPEFLVL